jgi:hypothetical protein
MSIFHRCFFTNIVRMAKMHTKLGMPRPMEKKNPFPICDLHTLLQHPSIRETLDNLESRNKRSRYNPIFTPLHTSMKDPYFLMSRVGLTWRLHTGAFTIKVPTVILENGHSHLFSCCSITSCLLIKSYGIGVKIEELVKWNVSWCVASRWYRPHGHECAVICRGERLPLRHL